MVKPFQTKIDKFLCSLQINTKKARQPRFSSAGFVCPNQNRVVYHPDVDSTRGPCYYIHTIFCYLVRNVKSAENVSTVMRMGYI